MVIICMVDDDGIGDVVFPLVGKSSFLLGCLPSGEAMRVSGPRSGSEDDGAAGARVVIDVVYIS